MRVGGRVVSLLIAVVAVSGFRSAEADKSAPVVRRSSLGPIPRVCDQPPPAEPLCTLGEVTAGVEDIDYIEPPNDLFFTLLHAPSCPTCLAPDTLLLNTAHAVLYFPVQCVQRLEVTIVGVGGTPGCPEPDLGHIICPPRTVDLEPNMGGQRVDLCAALSSPCKITEDAFLCVNFVSFAQECSGGENTPRPLLTLSDSTRGCQQCQSYNLQGTGFVDLCNLFQRKRPMMYVDAEMCLVPTRKWSWGSLKLYYR